MKANAKSCITLPPEEYRRVVLLKRRLKARSIVEVVRRGLRLLEEATERDRLRDSFRRASDATRASLAVEIDELDHLTPEGLEPA